MVEKLSLSEVFALFGRTPEQTRSVGSVDSEEYLTLVATLPPLKVEAAR